MKQNNKINKKLSKAAKPATVTDIAIRTVVTDLISRKQVPTLLMFCKDLGFNQSNQITYFLKGKRNYPKKKLEQAINVLKEKYRVSEEYLRNGNGRMYSGKPYMMPVNELGESLVQEDVANFAARTKIESLIASNQELRARIQLMEKIINDKDLQIERLQKLGIKK